MSILVVGATGTLGRQVTRRALDEGHEVRCLVRNYKRAAFLKEWGAELVYGNLMEPESLTTALEGVTAVIDAATSRASDSLTIRQVDWQGKVNLIQAIQKSNCDRYVFFSILDCEKYESVPLMQIKSCTEKFIKESGLNYTILRPCGFMQGLIGQYAIPILESQSVWVIGKTSPMAFMDTIDIAKFAVQALKVPETEKQSFPVVGSRAWDGYEIVKLCERLSDKTAKVTQVPIQVIRATKGFTRFFQWSWNISDRLSFSEVIATGKALTADMEPVYKVFGLNPGETSSLDEYMQEYFSRIMKKLKEIEYAQAKANKKKAKKNISWF
jgi:uncharacterized protein YbjT (DUF2867 family)